MSLFNLEPERYWSPPNNKDRLELLAQIEMRILHNKYLGSEKIDGFWSRFVREGDEYRQQSRTVSKVTGTYGEFKEKIPFITDFIFKNTTGDTILIGELYRPGGTLNEVKSILGSAPTKALARQNSTQDRLHYYIFDVWYWNGESLMETPFEERVKILHEEIKPKLDSSPFIHIAEYFQDTETFDRLGEILSAEGEGVVLQLKSGTPNPGKRTAWKSIKIKKDLERQATVVITKILPPTREYMGDNLETWPYWENERTGEKLLRHVDENRQLSGIYTAITKNYYHGWPSAVEVGAYDRKGKLIRICSVSGFSDDDKKTMAERPGDFYLMPITISGMEFTEDYSIRHPRFIEFRYDLQPQHCSWEDIFVYNVELEY